MEKELQLVESAEFNNIKTDFYSDGINIYMTINQLSKCLGYASKSGIEKILQRNSYLNSPTFQTTDKMYVVQGRGKALREVILFTEDGIYETTLLSKTKKAQEFRTWVRGVLKTIRETGGYVNQSFKFAQEYFGDCDMATQLFISTLLDSKSKLSNQVNDLLPKADMFDTFLNSKGYVSLNKVAKSLNKGRNRLMNFLRDEHILFKDGDDNIAYQRFCNTGLFKVDYVTAANGTIHAVTRVSPSGITYIKNLYDKTEMANNPPISTIA